MDDEKFMAMAGEMLDDEDCPVRVAPWASVLGARVWLAGHLEDVAHRVDAEATERAAKVCDGLEAAFIRSDEVQLASVAGACAEDIRSTLPTPAARAGEENQ